MHRLALALDRDLSERLEQRRVIDESPGELADHDLVRAGSLFELRRDAYRLAGDETLARVGRRRDDLAGLDPDPDLEPDAVLVRELIVEGRDRCPDVKSRAGRAQRVVLV